jgi:large subunit ribosomal protein L19
MAKRKTQTKKPKDLSRIPKPKEKSADFNIGDKVRVYSKIKEGKRTREAFFEGQVIALKGQGKSQTFTVRKIGTNQIPIERIFPKKSPTITRIDLIEKSKRVRRAKLYYLRNQAGR